MPHAPGLPHFVNVDTTQQAARSEIMQTWNRKIATAAAAESASAHGSTLDSFGALKSTSSP
jgi:hypothetical protein